MQDSTTPGASKGSALKGEDFTTFIKALTEKYGLFEGKSRIKPAHLDFSTPQREDPPLQEKPTASEGQVQNSESSATEDGLVSGSTNHGGLGSHDAPPPVISPQKPPQDFPPLPAYSQSPILPGSEPAREQEDSPEKRNSIDGDISVEVGARDVPGSPFSRLDPLATGDQASEQASTRPAPPFDLNHRRPPPKLSPFLLNEAAFSEALRTDHSSDWNDPFGVDAETPQGNSPNSTEGQHFEAPKQVDEETGSKGKGLGGSEATSNGQNQDYHESSSVNHQESSAPALRVGSWLALNRSLRDNGFNALRLPQEEGFQEDVHAVLRDLLKQYERRGSMVKEVLASNESAKQAESQHQSEVQALLQREEALESKVEILENQAREAAEGVDQAEAQLADKVRKLESANASLQQRCTQLQHLARAKERAAQKLQDKLEEGVLKEEKRRAREKEIYEKLKRKLAADARGRGIGDLGKAAAVAVRELQPAVLVGLYEAQREALESELTALRQELSAVHAELREKDNLIMRKDRAGGWRTLDVGTLLEKQLAAEKAATEKSLALAALEASLAAKQQDASRRIAEATKRADQLAEENANLQLELEARPSVREFQENKRLLAKLSRKIEELRTKRGDFSESESEDDIDALEEAELDEIVGRKQERSRPTRERIHRDRNVHRLRLKKLERLPKEVLLEALQDVCIQVEVSELTLLTSAVDKMLRVIAAVPRMERFISDVCSIVFLEGPTLTSNGLQRSPDAVPGVLRSWIETLGKVRELEEFQAVIASELARRPEGKQSVQGAQTIRNSAAAVKELVDLERDYLLKEATFRHAEGLVLADPERLIHKMLAHFQRLFEVPRLDGVFARINTVYTQYCEYHNFLRALRSLLGLPNNAGTSACIARIRGLLDQDGQARALIPEYVMGPVVADKRNLGSSNREEGGQPQAGPTREEEENKELVGTLMRLFNANDPNQLVAHCENTVSRLQRHTQVLPRYQSIINELYDILRVATLDAIVPAVQALQRQLT